MATNFTFINIFGIVCVCLCKCFSFMICVSVCLKCVYVSMCRVKLELTANNIPVRNT